MKKKLASIIILLFITFSAFAEKHRESISPKDGTGYKLAYDRYEEGDNVFIRPLWYRTDKNEPLYPRFNRTSYEGGGRHTDFLAAVKDRGTWCVGFMTDSINHGIGYCELIDCQNETQALEILYVFSVLLIEGDKNHAKPNYYPVDFVTEGIENTTYPNTQYEDLFPTWKQHSPEMLQFIATKLKPKYYFYPKETGFTSIPVAHLKDNNFYEILKKPNGYYIYRAFKDKEWYEHVTGADSAIGIYLDVGKTLETPGQPSLNRYEHVVKLESLEKTRFW